MGCKRGDRRRVIVEVATQLFCENGYSHTSMSMIAARLGGSKATLWAYFRCKQELFAASIEMVCAKRDELRSILAETEADLVSILLEFGIAYLRIAATDEALMVRRTIIGNPSLCGNRGLEFLYSASRMLGTYLSIDQTAKDAAIDHDIAARSFMALIESGYLQPMLYGFSPECDEVASVTSSVDLFMRAYGWANK